MPNRDFIRYDGPDGSADLTARAVAAPAAPPEAAPPAKAPQGARSGHLGAGAKPLAPAPARKGWLMPGRAEDQSARNPSRIMRGPTDHQADGQDAPHQAR